MPNRDSFMNISTLEGGMVEASNEKLAVFGIGQNRAEAEAEFWEMFDLQYRALVQCDPNLLTEEACNVRHHFENLIRNRK